MTQSQLVPGQEQASALVVAGVTQLSTATLDRSSTASNGGDSAPGKSVAFIEPLKTQQADDSHHPSSIGSIAEGPPIHRSNSSIYDLRSNRRKYIILIAAAVAAVLVPFSDTIYLPALKVIGEDFQADAGLVAASVSIYMVAVGIGSLFWGPLADKFGRRVTYVIGSVVFLGTTLGCIFAPTISVLVAFRALQGLAVAAYQTTGQGVISDVFPPAVRGIALGFFSIPLLVGPLLGPLLGGILSQSFGWRSTFICLAVFAGALAFPLLMIIVPETHQYRTIKQLSHKDLAVAAAIIESAEILSQKPKFQAPWVPLQYLIEADIAPYAALVMSTFGCMFASLTEWPAKMATPPYSLSESMMGVSYLAMGVAGLIASPIGGGMSDKCAAKFPLVPDARMMFNIALAQILMPTGLLIYAWTLEYNTSIVGPLVAHFVIGVACSGFLPGVFGYISMIKQQNASGAAAAVHAGMFIMAGVLISVSVAAVHGMGFGAYFTMLAGIQVLVAGQAVFVLSRRFLRVYGRNGSAAGLGEAPADDTQPEQPDLDGSV